MGNIDIFTPHSHHDKIPMVEGIHAGFPSPAEDYTEPVLDLNRYVIKNPASTEIWSAEFFVKIAQTLHADPS